MTTISAPETTATIVLKGGFTVSLPALRLMWNLEARGLNIRLAADGRILVGPNTHLDDHDRANIVRHRDELVALVRYCETVQ
jgi:hypothetical protein